MTINLFTTYDETISVAQICQKDYNNNPIGAFHNVKTVEISCNYYFY